MRQGRADHSNIAATKQEPISHAVNPCAVSEIGLAQAVRSEAVYKGRGYEAPSISSTTSNQGSQGRHS